MLKPDESDTPASLKCGLAAADMVQGARAAAFRQPQRPQRICGLPINSIPLRSLGAFGTVRVPTRC